MAKLCLPLGFVLAVMISADADNCLGGDCKAFGASSMLQSKASKAATAKQNYAEDVRPPANSSLVAKTGHGSRVILKRSLDATLSGKGGTNSASYPASSKNGYVTLDGRKYHVTGNHGSNPIVVYFHGNKCTCTGSGTDSVVRSLSGYTVAAPCDKTGDIGSEMWGLRPWAEGCYKSVKAWLGPSRKIGAVGHSMGGAAAIALTYTFKGTPTAALHPAHIISGIWSANGPILFTTGKQDTQFGCAPWGVRNKFNGASGVKRFVEFTDAGANHGAPCNANHPTYKLARKWMECYVRGSGARCDCSSLGLPRTSTCV